MNLAKISCPAYFSQSLAEVDQESERGESVWPFYCFIQCFHLRIKARGPPFLSNNDVQTLVHAFYMSHIDYCSSFFVGLST